MPTVRLDNGELVEVVARPGESDDQAAFNLLKNSRANPAQPGGPAYAQQPQQAAPQPPITVKPGPGYTGSVMGGAPSTWDMVKEYARSIATGVPQAAAGMGQALTDLPAMPRALWDKVMLGHPSEALKGYTRAMHAGTGEWNAAGADYQPKTPGADLAQTLSGGVAGAAMTGGTSLANLALGAGSAGLGYAGQNMKGGSPLMGEVAGALPYLAAAGKNAFAAGAPAYASAREMLERTPPGTFAKAQAVERAAQANGVPSMVWQNFPQGSAIRRAGESVAMTPGSPQIQQNLVGQSPESLGAIEKLKLALAAQQNPPPGVTNFRSKLQGNPADVQQLVQNLQQTAPLANADVGAALKQERGEHAGNIALGLELAKPLLPGAELVGGGMGLIAGARKRGLLSGPTAAVEDRLYSSPTLEDFRTAASTRPRITALRQLLQAYLVPGAQGLQPNVEGMATANPMGDMK